MPTPVPSGPRHAAWAPVLWLILLLAAGLGAALVDYPIATLYFRLQDRWLAPLSALLLLAGLVAGWAVMRGRVAPRRPGARSMAVLALAVLALGWAGHRWLLADYDLSRDEQMAVFDAFIYAHGHLVWPLPAAWRGDAPALNLLFMLPVARPVAWVSTYLPIHALLRAGMGLAGAAALTSPLLNAIAVLATWGAARRLFGAAEREGAGLAAVLLATSGQFLFAGMSAYAMAAHLACNMVWLWLFLADRRRADGAALAVGFLATGLHQPLFHPLFVAPFLLLLAARRRWGRLALFVLAYLPIGLFWLAWPHFTHDLVAGTGSVSQSGTSFAERLRDVLAANTQNLPLMAENLLRFAAWQAPVWGPLALIGGWAAWRQRQGEMLALAAGLVAPALLMAALLPFQGHGFGYRYLHGVLGNGALLAAWGWVALGDRRQRWRAGLVAALAAGALVLLPVEAGMAHALYAPFAAASARLDASGADYVLIGADEAPLALDLVRNRPDLANRPLRLSTIDIDPMEPLAARLCGAAPAGHPMRVGLPVDSFYAGINAALGMPPAHVADRRFAEDADAFSDAGCTVAALR
ncbi:MAG TPA: hypothetical protein VFF98_00680 [Novosphingobium sp.]|nr:hypothetical protein [Novosphingobium sp.]